jgi:hypothetical protein
MSDIEVDLVEPITVHGQSITRLTFREPRARDIRKHGEVFMYASNGDGQAIAVCQNDTLGAMMAETITTPNVTDVHLDDLSLVNFQRCKDAFRGFFDGSIMRAYGLESTSSSSTSGS